MKLRHGMDVLSARNHATQVAMVSDAAPMQARMAEHQDMMRQYKLKADEDHAGMQMQVRGTCTAPAVLLLPDISALACIVHNVWLGAASVTLLPTVLLVCSCLPTTMRKWCSRSAALCWRRRLHSSASGRLTPQR